MRARDDAENWNVVDKDTSYKEQGMRWPRVRMTLRGMMVGLVILAVLLATARSILGYLGPRDGFYTGSYRYLSTDWKWHEVRGSVIFVRGGMIFVD